MRRKTVNLNFEEICDIYDKPGVEPYWYVSNQNDMLSIEETLVWCDILLKKQYGDNAKQFIERLWDICEKKLEKKNSMFIKGPANCAKSWFIQSIVAAFYMNVGHVSNFVRGNNFPLNDCVERRILIWNEPSIMPSAYDDVKMLTGGDVCPANVKYQGNHCIPRTPLIFTSNKACFPVNNTIWTTRIYFEDWVVCEEMKHCKKRPNPLAFKHLINKYI